MAEWCNEIQLLVAGGAAWFTLLSSGSKDEESVEMSEPASISGDYSKEKQPDIKAKIAPISKELLKNYHGKEQLPHNLYQAYADLVRALEAGDPDKIQANCLPSSITVSAAPRTTNPEYGEDINLPFLKKGFHKYVISVRKDSPGTYLIRTGSTYMYFSNTQAGWKLYRYGDKPIM